MNLKKINEIFEFIKKEYNNLKGVAERNIRDT